MTNQASTHRPPIVLFDIDGTLVHTGGAGRRALDLAFKELYGIDEAFGGYAFSGKTDPRILRDAFSKWFQRLPTGQEYSDCHDAYVRIVEQELARTPHLMNILPGVVEILDALQERRIPTGLATGNVRDGGRLKLEVANLWHYFPFGGFGSDAEDRGELTRIGLYEGMKNRCTYGTSGARIVLLFRCGDSPMGSQIEMTAGKTPDFEIEVGGTNTLSEIALCRYDGSDWSEPFKTSVDATDRWSGRWQDRDFSGSGIYYVRVTQADGEQAWSSPIWIS